ncbi:uncharacterized protein LOC106649256 [Trichogramma pretiosum]|uniref:uncharacterized protein LOC106649256 n=1 Tax=Trichogramma pretiosum TaxID=7493 RepID=UPI0006C9C1CE|nr:uncharacterized protein LOC106649256 [Trichogramma pretiosum]
MEDGKNAIRVKDEPNDTWPDAGNEHIFDSMNFCKSENLKIFPFYKSQGVNHVNKVKASEEKLGKNISIEFECKYVKPEVKFLSKTIFKTEQDSCLPIVKIENRVEVNHLPEKSLVILIKKGFDYYNNCQFPNNSRLKLDEFEELEEGRIFDKITWTKLSLDCNLRKIYKRDESRKIHISTKQENIRSYKCNICREAFTDK